MKIGIAGPASPSYLQRFVPGSAAPRGLGGTPVNLLVERLIGLGHHVTLFTLDPEVKSPVRLSGSNLVIHVGSYRRQAARMLDCFRDERRYLARVMRSEAVDVIHAHWTYEYSLSAAEAGVPCVITAHDAPLSVLRYDFGPYRLLRLWMAKQALAKSQTVTAVSPYVASHLSRLLGVKTAIKVIPNGMPDEMFEAATFKSKCRGDLTFATILVGWAGRKNGQVAISAFQQHRRKHPKAKLVMFGAGHGIADKAYSWAKRKGLLGGVEFAGATRYDEILKRLRSEIDVLIHPSLEEAHPMVLIEAIAQGVPVIAGERSGGVPWTLDYGRAGLLVDVRSPAAVAKAMTAISNDADGRIKLAESAWEFAREQFAMSRVADAYVALYRQVVCV